MRRTKNGRIILLPKFTLCGHKKSIFIKEQEAKGLLSILGLKTPSNKIPLLDDIFDIKYKMNFI